MHKGNLIAATSGRSFWILDDLSAGTSVQEGPAGILDAIDLRSLCGEWRQRVGRPDEEFTGANTFRGVNPATGVVIHYHLPELKKDEYITIEIKDADGNPCGRFSSKADEGFKKWDGGPRAEPLLPKKQGLNRFVWDTRYSTMPGVPGVYIEGGLQRTQGAAGKYRSR